MKIIYTPCKNEQEAKKIAKILLFEKLIACANLIPSTSLYTWNGKQEEKNEIILIIKTSQAIKVEKRIVELHSYSLPCILTFSAKANKDFEKWVKMNEH